MRELPMTPIRVWEALRGRDLAGVGHA
jgi:hypothetical protein